MPFIVASANTRIYISDHPTVVNTFNMVIKWYAIYHPTTCEYIVLFWGVTVNTSLRILSSPYVIQFYTFSGRYVPLQVLVENSCTIIFPSICNMYMDVSLWHGDTYISCKPRSTYLMTKYLMIRKALQVSKQNHKTKVPHLNNIIAFDYCKYASNSSLSIYDMLNTKFYIYHRQFVHRT